MNKVQPLTKYNAYSKFFFTEKELMKLNINNPVNIIE